MDKGARYYFCDFQVHSFRDAGWTGRKFGATPESIPTLSSDEKKTIADARSQWAKEYLDKIRRSGLNAVAITDHHDVVAVKYVRAVANEENRGFIERSEPEKTIVVFPGIELSLSSPASQAIIVFDHDFPDEHLDSVLYFLGVTPSHELEKSTAQTQRISQENINDLGHLHKRLDELPYCKGKYIILPHVGNGSQHSILRQGFHEHYRKMPCAGGYVDKTISDEAGYLNKINGGDVHYGNKSIAVISTSDNRFEDGRELGKYATWIKWAAPTAEAIRQACLAKESRLSQTAPELPQVFISSMDVTASKFLSGFSLDLSRQYSALIGGRGTGKSTIVEYLRWALCDQTSSVFDPDELSSIERRREALIHNTLAELGGEVRVTMEKNGILHVVKRNAKTREILLKIGQADYQRVKEDDIRKILPIQSYSQKQLSDVGVKTEELKRFIEYPIASQLEAIRHQLSEVKAKMATSYTQLLQKRGAELEITALELEVRSLTEQIENIRKSLKGISADDSATINKKSKYDREATIVSNISMELRVFEGKAGELQSLLSKYPEPIGSLDEVENRDLIQLLEAETQKKFREIEGSILGLQALFDEKNAVALNSLILEWQQKKAAYDTAYENAKKSSQASQEQLAEIQRIEVRISEANRIISERKSSLKEMGLPEADFASSQTKWVSLHVDKVSILNLQAERFTALSKGLIKAQVTRSLDLTPLKSQLKTILEGTRIREERIEAVATTIATSDDPISKYAVILEELRSLAEFTVSEEKVVEMPSTPVLTSTGLGDEHRAKIASKMTTDDFQRILGNELEFNPEFFYLTNNQLGDVIPFREASAGQQATALLTVLLSQPGVPLIIDQPEDDIDNRAIDQIVKNIWEAKKRRQLIFTSHNANLVVNGDAELVVCCDYKDSTSQTRGIIKYEGSIDSSNIKDEITTVMEGGEKAFKLRKEKYGF